MEHADAGERSRSPGPAILATLSFRTSVVLLGLVAAGSADVGEYGAAFRLIEATIVRARLVQRRRPRVVLPRGRREIARGFEMAIKTVLALVLPIGLGMALFAEPLIEALYGPTTAARSPRSGCSAPWRCCGA